MNGSICKDIFLEEVQKTIKSLPKGKAPSLDGIPIEFFTITFLNTSIKVYKTIKETGNVPDELNPSMVILIFKSRNHSKIGNWCPIAKVLSIKLQTFL
jgi:hypothetical protein